MLASALLAGSALAGPQTANAKPSILLVDDIQREQAEFLAISSIFGTGQEGEDGWIYPDRYFTYDEILQTYVERTDLRFQPRGGDDPLIARVSPLGASATSAVRSYGVAVTEND